MSIYLVLLATTCSGRSPEMAIQEENSSSSLHFFKIILTETKLKLPSRFVKDHGNNLSEYACLQVPTGELTWQVELKRDGRGVWLDRGWQDFVEYYSIKCAYFLVFRYEGESRFRVFIFDTTTLEIQYPVGAANASRSRVELDQSKLIKFKEGDSDEEEDDDDRCPQKLQKTREVMRTSQSSNLKARHFTSVVEKNVERAKALKSQNPCFIIRMKSFHVSDSKSRLYIPRSHAKSHFLENGNNGIYLNVGEYRRAWFVKYSIAVPPWHQVCLHTSGWSIFMKENHLQVGDVCVFELVNSATMAYKVTIFRIADYA